MTQLCFCSSILSGLLLIYVQSWSNTPCEKIVVFFFFEDEICLLLKKTDWD